MSNIIPRQEHPRPDLMRDNWLNLNGEWDFEIDNDKKGVDEGFFNRHALNDKIIVPFCPESKLSGIAHIDFMNAVWYRRDLEIPAQWSGKRIILHIGACDYETTVYINGVKVGKHTGGYTSFSFDITAALRDSDNYVTVYAEDDTRSYKQLTGKQSTQQNSYGCFYTRTTGIWQTVWLEAVEKAYIHSYKVYPNVTAPSVSLAVKTNTDALGATLKVNATYKGRDMGSATATVTGSTTTLTIPLSETHMWEVGRGRLYDLSFELKKNGNVDIVRGYFGLREVTLTKEKGLQINGKTVFGRFVLDQGFYPDGIYTAPSDDALRFDVEASISCGFNGARLHQKVFEPRFLYHADTHGYMVWGESGNWGFDHTDFNNLQNMLPEWIEEVERDFSHPSIIGWCPFNETWDINGKAQCNELIDTVYDVTKAMDFTRPTIANSGSFPTNRTDVHDVHDYEQDPAIFASYYADIDKGTLTDQIARMFPTRQEFKSHLPIFVSEYGGIKWAPDAIDEAWGYGNSVMNEQEFFDRLEGLTDAILDNPLIFAFCYTQLTDVEQEQNGVLTYDRKFKFHPAKFARIFSKIAAIEGGAK